MARKPNYAFERNARAKAKAEKREAKRQAKLLTKVEGDAGDTPATTADDTTPDVGSEPRDPPAPDP